MCLLKFEEDVLRVLILDGMGVQLGEKDFGPWFW